MKLIYLTVLIIHSFAFASRARADERPPGDYEPEYRWVCECTCGTSSQWVRVWDNVRREYSYVRHGVPLYYLDELGHNYGFQLPVAANQSCQHYQQSACSGLYQPSVGADSVRLNGRYSCYGRRAIPIRE